MKTTGKLMKVTRDILTRKMILSFCVEDVEPEVLNGLADKDLVIDASIRKGKRSLSANSYFHVLVGKIADSQTISKAKAKNILISKYGQPQLLDDGSPMVYKTNAPVEYMMEQEAIHAIPVKYSEEQGKEVVFYKIYRGSSTYNTEEMSKLIDGTVADAKELGIETLSPSEIARMKALWIQ